MSKKELKKENAKLRMEVEYLKLMCARHVKWIDGCTQYLGEWASEPNIPLSDVNELIQALDDGYNRVACWWPWEENYEE